jgi:hypothetical protein
MRRWTLYDVPRALPMAVEWMRSQSWGVVVTTDAEGWVRSIEEVGG